MAATAVNLAWQTDGTARRKSYTVVDADIIYDGTMVTIDGSGEAHPARDTSGDRFAGIAVGKVDNTDDGETVVVDCSSDRLFWAVAGSGFTAVVGDIGELAYVGDDQTVVSAANATNNILAGRIVDFDNANTRVLVKSMPFLGAVGAAGGGTAFTQTYSTADATLAARGSSQLTDNSGGTDPADQTIPALTTLNTLTLSNMDDGSGNDTLIAIGDTSTSNESGNIEQNFDKMGDEVNNAKTAIDEIANFMAQMVAEFNLLQTDHIDTTQALNSVIDLLQTLELAE